jgi:hypothetical protein
LIGGMAGGVVIVAVAIALLARKKPAG